MFSGVWPQVYRGKVSDRNAMDRGLAAMAAAGCTGVVMHGFTMELDAARFDILAHQAIQHGLQCAAAFGMDSSDPAGKGQRIGAVASLSSCAFVALDAEGAWEDEASDKAAAVTLGQTLRAAAPHALLCDQPWPLPTYHWSMFPWEEFAAFVDWRSPQFYVNDWASQYGTHAYETMWPRFEAAWQKLETERLKPKGLFRVRKPTIQGYGWNLPDLVSCLTANPDVLMWSEPFPDAIALCAIRTVGRLGQLGHTGPSAVADFQRAAGLTPDGICGPRTLAALGIAAP